MDLNEYLALNILAFLAVLNLLYQAFKFLIAIDGDHAHYIFYVFGLVLVSLIIIMKLLTL